MQMPPRFPPLRGHRRMVQTQSFNRLGFLFGTGVRFMSFMKATMGEFSILSIAQSMSIYKQVHGKITLCVHPIDECNYGVYANAVLIAIHKDQVTADAHCQRLSSQQAER